ncbi:N-acetylmuramoyl-L-alanine amidase [Paenibacillus sp. IB182496]|uniref:N-acetylmuramoyl-L-alanine amidase n=1 Tax=Paenibacillus sabuli TaxID=2772509 RepID=A0A927GTR9_9BACL|nr:N-acetylmuramoyl-L-alanine amidase [Paenibacillus sabuli]MBD2847908.1 N-acetylmuramoyl-L-alanine amidase [Paenibacillus sabuli]
MRLVRLLGCFLFIACLLTDRSSARAARTEPEYHRALPEAEILIDVGHGGIDGGTFAGATLEKDINLAVAGKLYLLLRAHGLTAIMNRTGDYALSDENRWHASRSRHNRDLVQRGQLPRELRTKLLVSLHVNWARNARTRGPLILHQDQGESYLLASFLQDALNAQQRTDRLPRIGKPFYLLRRVEQPAVIIEMGFISNVNDRQMLTTPVGQTKIAQAIAAGLRQYLTLAGN